MKYTRSISRVRNSLLLCLIISVAMLTACTGTKTTRTGFLGDRYASMQPAPRFGESAKGWRAKSGPVNTGYKKVIIDPVQLWLTKGEIEDSGVDLAELQALTRYFHEQLVKAMQGRLEVVTVPAPDTFRLSAAITGIETANPAMKTISSVLPVGVLISLGKKAFTGSHTNVGSMDIEMLFKDSMTGRDLGALVAHRDGDKYTLDEFGRLDYARKASDDWSKALGKLIDYMRASAHKQ